MLLVSRIRRGWQRLLARLLSGLTAFLLLTLPLAVNAAAVLTADYHFDECKPWPTTGGTGVVKDSSGKGNHATPQYTPQSENSLFNKGADFRGWRNADLIYPGNSVLNGNIKGFAIALAFRTTDSKPTATLFSAGYRRSLSIALLNGNKLGVTVNGYTYTVNARGLNRGNWSHLVVKRESPTEYSMVINGRFFLRWRLPASTQDFSLNRSAIGYGVDWNGNPASGTGFVGEIDEVMVFENPDGYDSISDEQAVQIIDNLLNKKNHDGTDRVLACDSLLYWNMEQQTGNVTADASANGFDATLIDDALIELTDPPGPALSDTTNASFSTCQFASLDGSRDYLENRAVASRINGLTEFTLMGWVYADSDSPQNMSLFSGRTGTHRDTHLGLRYDSTTSFYASVRVVNGNSVSRHVIATVGQPLTRGWHHVAMTWQSNSPIEVFVDGNSVAVAGSTAVLQGSVYGVQTFRAGSTYHTMRRGDWQGKLDEIRFYEAKLDQDVIRDAMNAKHPCGAGIDHYELHLPRVSLSCEAVPIKVVACANNSNPCDTPQTAVQGETVGLKVGATAINLTIGADGWARGSYSSSSANTNDSADDVVAIDSVTAAAAAANKCCPDGVNCSVANSCTTTVYKSGFVYNVADHRSAVAQNVEIAAVRMDEQTQACVPSFKDVNKSLGFSCQYENPNTGTQAIELTGTSGNQSIACNSNQTQLTLAFNAAGKATTQLKYSDAGKLKLDAYALVDNAQMRGSDSFVVAPSKFVIASSGPFVAGDNFGASVTAINSSNATTPNFGRETSAEGANLSFSRCQPSAPGSSDGSFSGSLGGFGAANAGVASAADLNWSEVGNGDLTATLKNPTGYLGSGMVVNGTTGTNGVACNTAGNVGPFIPHHFVTEVTEACGDFSYSGQPFELSITAQNKGNETTVNYSGSFAKEVTLAEDSDAGSLESTTVASSEFSAGVAEVEPAFSFDEKQTPPASVSLRATDSDSVSSENHEEGSVNIRSGRLRMQNVYGRVSAMLNMPLQVEYWGEGSWILNNDDNCTRIPQTAFFLSGGLPATTLSGDVTLVNGQADLGLTPPQGATGNVEIAANLGASRAGDDQSCLNTHGGTPAEIPWLRSRNGSCSTEFDRDPSARASFGIYSPESQRVIETRELF